MELNHFRGSLGEAEISIWLDRDNMEYCLHKAKVLRYSRKDTETLEAFIKILSWDPTSSSVVADILESPEDVDDFETAGNFRRIPRLC